MKLPALFRTFALSLALVPVASAADSGKKLLVVTITTGFRHSSIPVAEQVVSRLAAESGKFSVEFVRQPAGEPRAPTRPRAGAAGENDPAHREALAKFEADQKAYAAARATWLASVAAALEKLSPANLARYDGVMFLSTTGDLPLPSPQGFIDWIAAGKAFVGVHAAADTFHKTGAFEGFPPYTAMLGGAFRTHGPQVAVECINQDPKHPACVHLPAKWSVFDEIYEFKDFSRPRVQGLLTLDKHPQTKQPDDNPVAWTRAEGKGRVFYTSLGHREDLWDPTHTGGRDGRKNSPETAQQFQQHLLGGILWALGLEQAR